VGLSDGRASCSKSLCGVRHVCPSVCLYCTVRLTAVLTRAVRYVRSAVGRVRGKTGSEGHQVYLRDSDTYCFLPLYGQSEGARPAERPAVVNVDKDIYIRPSGRFDCLLSTQVDTYH
jgi:hypothetical protein